MNSQETSTSKTKYEHEIARIKAVLGQLQSENRELKFSQANSSSLDNSGAGGGGVGDKGDKDAFNAFSDATKSLSRKMKTNFTSAVTNLVPIKSPTTEDLHALAASSEAALGLANDIFLFLLFRVEDNFGLKVKLTTTFFEFCNPLDLSS